MITSFFINSVKCQSNDDCKYLSVLVYLRTNKAVNDQIKQSFPALTKRKDKYVEFSISDRVEFIGISDFKRNPDINTFGIDSPLINNNQLYYNKYFFTSYTLKFLNKAMEQPEQDKVGFYLTFSKSIDDYLVTELTLMDPRIHHHMGNTMQMLFKFNSDGLIEKCIYAWAAYR